MHSPILRLALIVIFTSPVSALAAVPASRLGDAYSYQCSAIVHRRWDDFNRSLAPKYIGRNLGGPADSYASEGGSISQTATRLA
jgi:hypothetical protein